MPEIPLFLDNTAAVIHELRPSLVFRWADADEVSMSERSGVDS
jgi:hypothetical protein